MPRIQELNKKINELTKTIILNENIWKKLRHNGVYTNPQYDLAMISENWRLFYKTKMFEFLLRNKCFLIKINSPKAYVYKRDVHWEVIHNLREELIETVDRLGKCFDHIPNWW